jgi:ADP-ribose pyrophosphatase YjhB (NUDIX family)
MRRFLLQVWRVLPLWLQVVLSRIIRPLFQVFSAAIILDSECRIFLVKSTYQRFHPWGMPGGNLEYGESAQDAIIREVWEETGFHVTVEKLLMTKTFAPDKFALYFLCVIKDGVFQPSDEVSEYGYFPLDNLPDIRSGDVVLLNEVYEMMGIREHELA